MGLRGTLYRGKKSKPQNLRPNPPSICVPMTGTKSKAQTFVRIDGGETTTVEFAHRRAQSGLVSGMTYNML